MAEVTPFAESYQSPVVHVNYAQSPGADTDTSTESSRISTWAPRRTNAESNNTPKVFEGATLRIGGVLAIRNENVTKKVNYDVFLWEA